MGESRSVVLVVRTAAVAVITGAAAVVLTSCSLLGVTPVSDVPKTSGPVVDPSIPSAHPAASHSAEPVETPTPTPTEAASVAPAPTPSATATAVAARTAVTPFISSATVTNGELDVSAIVPKTVERGGTCTLTARLGDTTRTVRADAAAASTYMGCQPLTIRGLADGTWQVQVRYTSGASAGSSATKAVTAG